MSQMHMMYRKGYMQDVHEQEQIQKDVVHDQRK